MRFSLKSLLRSITLVSIGIGTVAVAFNCPRLIGTSEADVWKLLLLELIAASIVGAGVGALFKHPFIGALLGAVAFIVIGEFLNS